MGRIKTAQIKRVTFELLRRHQDMFKNDFDYNKEVVGKLAGVQSLKIRNKIAGYITKMMKDPDNIVLKIH